MTPKQLAKSECANYYQGNCAPTDEKCKILRDEKCDYFDRVILREKGCPGKKKKKKGSMWRYNSGDADWV